jgi:putative cell wall-binding protein
MSLLLVFTFLSGILGLSSYPAVSHAAGTIHVTIRVEGPDYTMLPETVVEVPDGAGNVEALQAAGLEVTGSSGMVDAIEGVEGDPYWSFNPFIEFLKDGNSVVYSGNGSLNLSQISLPEQVKAGDSFTVTVTKENDGSAVSGAEIIYYQEGDYGAPIKTGIQTDASGQAALSIADVGAYFVAAEGSNIVRTKAKAIQVKATVIDKTELNSLITEAEQLKSGDYTEESWADFTEALQAAQTVSAKADATQEEVDNAYAALSAAKAQLVTLSGPVNRIAGGNRYDTSAKTALDAYPGGAETVIIARGDDEGNFADGLAASYLAGVKDAPVLLTSPGSLPQEIEAAIEQLGAKKAYVLGGELAVSQGVENKLKSLELQVERITGNNRYDTAAEIAAEGGNAETAIVVSGFAPADSLVAGPLAFSREYPILLTNKNSVPAETKKAIEELGIEKIIVVGGENVVGKIVYYELKAQERYAGRSRIETSLEVAEKLFATSNDFSIVGYLKLADAVGAAVNGNPIIYVKDNLSDVEGYLTEASAANFTIFGGTLAVSDTVENELKELLK